MQFLSLQGRAVELLNFRSSSSSFNTTLLPEILTSFDRANSTECLASKNAASSQDHCLHSLRLFNDVMYLAV